MVRLAFHEPLPCVRRRPKRKVASAFSMWFERRHVAEVFCREVMVPLPIFYAKDPERVRGQSTRSVRGKGVVPSEDAPSDVAPHTSDTCTRKLVQPPAHACNTALPSGPACQTVTAWFREQICSTRIYSNEATLMHEAERGRRKHRWARVRSSCARRCVTR